MKIFSKPTGFYRVGTCIKHIIDSSRKEVFSENKNEPRELIIQLFYPAQSTDENFSYYASDVMQEWVEGLLQSGFPKQEIEELKNQKTYSVLDAPLNLFEKPYPVLIFSHGYVALRSAYTAYYEQLASHGYIVVAISHTYYCKVTKFSDGKAIFAVPVNSNQENLLLEESSQEQQKIWTDDIKYVLDYLEKLNSSVESIFYHALDLNNMGMIGHSFGGSTAIQMCRIDDRIKAAVNLDGALFGTNPIQPIEKPIMFILGKESFDIYKAHSDTQIAKDIGFPLKLITILRKKYFEYIPKLFEASPRAYLVTIDGAKHAAFSDWVLLKELPLYKNNKHLFDVEKQTGKVIGSLLTNVVNNCIIAFFDKYLKDKTIDVSQKIVHEIASIQ